MNSISFASVMGYILGITIILVSARIFFAPFRTILKILLNSVAGGVAMMIINWIPFLNISLGINLISVLTVGILGIPGLCLLLAAQIFF